MPITLTEEQKKQMVAFLANPQHYGKDDWLTVLDTTKKFTRFSSQDIEEIIRYGIPEEPHDNVHKIFQAFNPVVQPHLSNIESDARTKYQRFVSNPGRGSVGITQAIVTSTPLFAGASVAENKDGQHASGKAKALGQWKAGLASRDEEVRKTKQTLAIVTLEASLKEFSGPHSLDWKDDMFTLMEWAHESGNFKKHDDLAVEFLSTPQPEGSYHQNCVDLHNRISDRHMRSKEWQKAKEGYEKALTILSDNPKGTLSPQSLAITFSNHAYVSRHLQDYHAAANSYLSFFNTLNDHPQSITTFFPDSREQNIAKLQEIHSDFESSLDSYLQTQPNTSKCDAASHDPSSSLQARSLPARIEVLASLKNAYKTLGYNNESLACTPKILQLQSKLETLQKTESQIKTPPTSKPSSNRENAFQEWNDAVSTSDEFSRKNKQEKAIETLEGTLQGIIGGSPEWKADMMTIMEWSIASENTEKATATAIKFLSTPKTRQSFPQESMETLGFLCNVSIGNQEWGKAQIQCQQAFPIMENAQDGAIIPQSKAVLLAQHAHVCRQLQQHQEAIGSYQRFFKTLNDDPRIVQDIWSDDPKQNLAQIQMMYSHFQDSLGKSSSPRDEQIRSQTKALAAIDRAKQTMNPHPESEHHMQQSGR